MNPFDFIETREQIRRAACKSVLLDQSEVLRLVVEDLVAKYKANRERKDREWVDAFGKTLRYYLTQEEFEEAIR